VKLFRHSNKKNDESPRDAVMEVTREENFEIKNPSPFSMGARIWYWMKQQWQVLIVRRILIGIATLLLMVSFVFSMIHAFAILSTTKEESSPSRSSSVTNTSHLNQTPQFIINTVTAVNNSLISNTKTELSYMNQYFSNQLNTLVYVHDESRITQNKQYVYQVLNRYQSDFNAAHAMPLYRATNKLLMDGALYSAGILNDLDNGSTDNEILNQTNAYQAIEVTDKKNQTFAFEQFLKANHIPFTINTQKGIIQFG
jgi:hypothetical protein